jgi:hypothetical protein
LPRDGKSVAGSKQDEEIVSPEVVSNKIEDGDPNICLFLLVTYKMRVTLNQ